MNKHTQGIGMTSQRTRDRLIERLRHKGIQNHDVLEAMRLLPRHLFVDEALASRAYEDDALPIGHKQTISQPYIVARMTEALLAGDAPKKVLEIGTGSGYQAALLAQLVEQVYTLERIKPLYLQTKKRLASLNLRNVRCKLSDGTWGWEGYAPYDAIIVTCAAPEIPTSLIEQLTLGGCLIIPVGAADAAQQLLTLKRTQQGVTKEKLEDVLFVPLVRD
ncbi:MAG: protein-L-isoaspartate O-methyltransferase [Gammaproteobacteria bacterium TMED119]|nr:MAG: protein-L-isoaspartate O-methyltransferase [Gammaproteobacteria bacterium TMED119]|tara:strand:- start:1027 stop:1683 length:657 start_codon:yes stop_codon:yes gene_type:complete